MIPKVPSNLFALQLTAVKPGSDRIKSGEYLAVDESIVSPNGQYSATLQSDGNLVLRRIPTNTTLWATYIAPHNSTIKLALGYDSNLVIYGSNSTKLWSTGTKREDHGRLIIGNNGNLILQRDWMNSALWHTNTIVSPPQAPKNPINLTLPVPRLNQASLLPQSRRTSLHRPNPGLQQQRAHIRLHLFRDLLHPQQARPNHIPLQHLRHPHRRKNPLLHRLARRDRNPRFQPPSAMAEREPGIAHTRRRARRQEGC